MVARSNQVVIELTGLTKKFGAFTALDKFDLSVRAGEVHGFLGPNGSGKSTAIRVILGLLRKTDGVVALFGRDPWKDAVELHARLAYVPGDVSLWPNLSGGEVIDLLGDLRGGLHEKRRKDLLQRFELDPTKKFRTYSKGNRQKVALIAALASDVELYILDEPTSGLDPLMEVLFQECIKDLKTAGKTILLSSHILAEVETLCDHVTIIREGRAVDSGSFDDLRKLHRSTISVQSPDDLSKLAQLTGVYHVESTVEGVKFEIESDQIGAVIKYLSKHEVTNLVSHPPALEDVFLRHYSGDVR